jgi:hypothetical protein
MKIISLGGVGGCVLAETLRHLKQEAYPYDWLIATQDFVMNSFNNFDKFFAFDEKYVYDKYKLLDPNKKAIMLHDFDNFTLQKEDVINKYKRRFERLNKVLNSNEDILFVRYYDNVPDKLTPFNYYDNILIRNYEDITKWESFINSISNKYNKKIKLLIICNIKDLCTKKYKNIILYFVEDRSNYENIGKIIKNIVRTKC